jgi:aminoglycoside phosphotransferase (APT) family kinase protein
MTVTPVASSVTLDSWLAERLPGACAGAQIARIVSINGTSNEMFTVRSAGNLWVLRRPPAVANAPSAHNVLREFGILRALDGTDVPHPRPIAACADPRVFERPFYVMEHVDGFSGERPLPPPYDRAPAPRRGLGIELVDALAKVARVDWRAAGFRELGHPDGFLARQVDRWLGQLESYRTRELAGLDDLVAWLRANRPPDGLPGLLHGDYSPFNVLFAREPVPRLVAIVDWEMATIGDPLLDIGWLLGQWADSGVDSDLIDGGITGLNGMPSMSELADRYEDHSGRSLQNVRFYMALAIFKVACIIEGAYSRFVQGRSNFAESHRRFGTMVPRMILRAHGIAEGTRAASLGGGR